MNNKIFDSNNFLKKYQDIFESSQYDGDFKSFLKKNTYKIIKESKMFDEEYYSNMYPDTIGLDIDLIEHYIKYGVFEYCNPNTFFNTKNYLECFKSECDDLNPFVHYLLYGKKNNSTNIINNREKSYNFHDNFCIILIDNNAELTKKTLKSISENNIQTYIINSHEKKFQTFDEQMKFNINEINKMVKKIKEKFFIILFSGDKITEDLIKFMSLFYSKDSSEIGAIIFDHSTYYSINEIYNFKPTFSPDLYLEYDYIKNSIAFNKTIVQLAGLFDMTLDDNFIRDMLFKIYEKKHLILKEDIIGFKLNYFHTNTQNNDKIFLEKYIHRNKINGKIQISPHTKCIYDTDEKKASIIIPFKDNPKITEKCIESILNKTKYENYEIILVNNNSTEFETSNFIDKYEKHEKIFIINYTNEFNYSKINNFAAKIATGDVLIFLNNDTEVLSENWLSIIIGDAIQKNIGAVGAKLFYPDKTIQHIGVVIGLNGLAGHLYSGEVEENIPEHYIKYRRNVSAVTGACMGIEKNLFEEIGGFDELFEITGNDVEICLRLLKKGFRNIINPQISLIHHEKKTRSKIKVRDIDIMLSIEYYKEYLNKGDPFFNKHFSLNSNKIILKKKNEIPIFEDFLNKYYKEKNNHVTKLNNIIKKKKEQSITVDKEVIKYDVSSEELKKNAILMDNFIKNPNLELNKVMWFIPHFDHIFRGGIYTIFRIANHFSKFENTDNIFVLYGGVQRNINEIEKEISRTFPKLKFELIDMDEQNNVSNLPQSDIGICTFWTTAYILVKYNNCKAKFYLNQDYEPLFSAANSVYALIEQTYRFNFIGLANSKGVYKKYASYSNLVSYFTPAVDKKIFYPNTTKIDNKKRIVFYARPNNPRNGFILGIEALKIVKSYFGNSIEIYAAGGDFNLETYGLNGIITNLGLIDSLEKVAELYRKCDIGLVFMFTPHPSYQPLEYMACGCATVSNINENNGWLLKNMENAILSEPTISCVAESIINLIKDEELRENIISNGYKTIENLDWNIELNKILEFIKNPLNK